MNPVPTAWLEIASALAMCARRLECTCLRHDLPWTKLKADEPERICHACRTLERYRVLLAQTVADSQLTSQEVI